MPKASAIADPAAAEGSIRDILARLRAANDLDTAEVLASGLNTFQSALIRFRGDTCMISSDITALFELWEILLNLAKAKSPALVFAPKLKPGAINYADDPKPAEERREP